MGLEAHASLARHQEAWPTVRGQADSPDDAAEWAGRKPDGKALTMADLQRAISHADPDARAAALFATREADAKEASSQVPSAALADLTRLRSCAGSLESTWLSARPYPAELTAVEFCIRASLRLGENLFAGQVGDDACVCGRSMASGGTHSLICGVQWHTVVARHNALTEASLRIAARGRIAATREPQVKQLAQRSRAMGLPALPTRPPPVPSAVGHMPTRASPAAPGIPHPTPASAVPSTLHGTQAHPPVPSAAVAPPTPGVTAAAEPSSAVALGETSAGAAPAVANAAAAPNAAVATATPAIAPTPAPKPPATPDAAAAAHSGGATGTTRFPPRSQGDQCVDLRLHLPWRPVAVHVCVIHPLASPAVAAAAWGTTVSPEAKFALTRDKYCRTGTGACRFVPLSHETDGRTGPPPSALLHELAEFAASTGHVGVSKKNLHGERDARPFHDAMRRHHKAGPCLGAVASAPRWTTGPPGAACPNRWTCLKSRPRRGAVLAPGSGLAAHFGRWVRSATCSPPPPHSQSLLPRPATCLLIRPTP